MRLIDADRLHRDFLKNDWEQRQIHDIIEEAPTVDAAQVVHGHFTYIRDDAIFDVVGYCSVCGDYNLISNKFCGHCGAIMDEVDINNG